MTVPAFIALSCVVGGEGRGAGHVAMSLEACGRAYSFTAALLDASLSDLVSPTAPNFLPPLIVANEKLGR